MSVAAEGGRMTCDDCGKAPRHGDIMIRMLPGCDGADWYLCSPCWRESTKRLPPVVRAERGETVRRERQGSH